MAHPISQKVELVGAMAFEPKPASFVIQNTLMKRLNLDVDELSSKTGIPSADIAQMLSGKLAIEKKHVKKLRRVFGKAVRPLLKIDRLHAYYVKTGRIHYRSRAGSCS